jgi:hypothetical protein
MTTNAYVRGMVEAAYEGRTELSRSEVELMCELAFEAGQRTRRELPPITVNVEPPKVTATQYAEIYAIVRQRMRAVLDPEWRRSAQGRCPVCIRTYEQHNAAQLLDCAEAGS